MADQATKIYVQGVVEPLQLDLEDMINDKLLQSETYEFKFNNVDMRDHDLLVKRLATEIEHGMKTPSEARKELGLPGGSDEFFMNSSFMPVDGLDEEFEE